MRLSEYTDSQLLHEMARRGGSTVMGGAAVSPEPEARRDWHPSGASLAWWAGHGAGRGELKADEWDAHDLVSRHLLECDRCRGEVARLKASGPANAITRHRRRWVLTGDGPEVAEFRDEGELRAIPWVNEATLDGGRLVLDGHYLVQEWPDGRRRTIGRLSSVDGLELPGAKAGGR